MTSPEILSPNDFTTENKTTTYKVIQWESELKWIILSNRYTSTVRTSIKLSWSVLTADTYVVIPQQLYVIMIWLYSSMTVIVWKINNVVTLSVPK